MLDKPQRLLTAMHLSEIYTVTAHGCRHAEHEAAGDGGVVTLQASGTNRSRAAPEPGR
jgi:hypothetical protein